MYNVTKILNSFSDDRGSPNYGHLQIERLYYSELKQICSQ